MIGLEEGFEHHSGDSRTLEVTINDEVGAVVDISSATLTWGLSKKSADTTTPMGAALITKTIGSGITITDGPNGRCDVAIDPADTDALAGDFYHELEMVLTGETSTVLYGAVTILKDLV